MQTGQSDQTHQVCRNSEKSPDNGEMPLVRMETIDHYMEHEGIAAIDLLKIDVEWYKLEVLEGAKNALERRKISTVLTECDFKVDKTNSSIEPFLSMVEFISPAANIRRIDQNHELLSITALLKVKDVTAFNRFSKEFQKHFPNGRFSCIDVSSMQNE